MKERTLFPTSRQFAARMNRRALPLMMGLLLLPLGCGGNDGGPLDVDEPTDQPLVLQPSELCSDNSEHDIATFEDAILEARIKVGVGFPYDDLDAESLTCAMVSALTDLQGPVGIESLVGIQNLTGLTTVSLDHGSFTDISPLSGLTNLEGLRLNNNSISDISALSGLTGLTDLTLFDNPISDISPLSGLTNLTDLWLDRTLISDISPLSGLAGLTTLILGGNSITDISPLSGLTNLEGLTLGGNSITDISALDGLTGLESLDLNDNSISDITVLSGLTNLKALSLGGNLNLTDIQPLLDNTGLGMMAAGQRRADSVGLFNTNVSCSDVALLEAKGVDVSSDCP